jgi:hypothetical protein
VNVFARIMTGVVATVLWACASGGRLERQPGELRGWWIRDYERLEFLPCDFAPLDRVWVRFAPGIWEVVSDTLSLRRSPDGADTLFVRFVGTLSAPDTVRRLGSGYGHLNAYVQEIVVDRVAEARNLRASDCSPRPPKVRREAPAG